MFGITVFSDTIIIFSAVEYILKHVPHGQVKQEISLKKIFGGSQILTINATKFAGFRRNFLCMLESKTSGVVILFLSQF